MNITALYPGSFDPLTLGHEDIIARSVHLFDRIIVAVGQNSGKPGFLSVAQRVALIQQVCEAYPTVQVMSFEGLLVDLAKQLKVSVVVRGVRNSVDWEYEWQQAVANRTLYPELEVVVLPPRIQWQAVSSTLVRQIASLGGDISSFVSPLVAKALQR